MNIEKRDFDKAAATWDDNTVKVRLANDIADAILSQDILTSDMDALDFGCGTGLLTLRLQPFVKSITGVDSSRGMLDIINAKISAAGLANVRTQSADLDMGGLLAGSFQLITSAMTLHHVRETEPLFDQFYDVTAPGGYLCIADLDLDGGRFHEDSTGVFHPGFDRYEMGKIFETAGFDMVLDITAAEVVKPVSGGETMKFDIFLMIGRKRAVKGAQQSG